jgi:phosphopantetheine binding protein
MNQIDTIVLEQAKDILGKADLSLADDFFDVGGDSVAGMHFVGRVGRQLGLPIRTTLLFGSPVLADFAAGVAAVQQRHTAADGVKALA